MIIQVTISLTYPPAGTGNVSRGAQELFQDLPHEYVTIKGLKKVAEKGGQSGQEGVTHS